MYIKDITWLDKNESEAIVEVAQDANSLLCFSCPCSYTLNAQLSDPLECLDANGIVICNTVECDIKKLEGTFEYRMIGKVKDKDNGIIDVCGFDIHIDETLIPHDIANGMYIGFMTSRIDIW